MLHVVGQAQYLQGVLEGVVGVDQVWPPVSMECCLYCKEQSSMLNLEFATGLVGSSFCQGALAGRRPF